jgi:hypothetical protein
MEKKGYYTNGGYMGLVSGKWQFFATEKDYLEHIDGKEQTIDDVIIENHHLKERLDKAKAVFFDQKKEIAGLEDRLAQAAKIFEEQKREIANAQDCIEAAQYRRIQKTRDILYGFAYEFKKIIDGKQEATKTCIEMWYAMTIDIMANLEQAKLWNYDDYNALDN